MPACVHAHVYFPNCMQMHMFVITLVCRLVAFFMTEEHISFSAMELPVWWGPRSPATSAAHLTCRNRPQECSLINLNYSFPDSPAPRSVVNPSFWFKSSERRLFRQRGPLNTSCKIPTNLNTNTTYIHHKVPVCAPSYQCLNNTWC